MTSSWVSSSLENVMGWARASSLWYTHVGGGCCADEMIAAQSCRYDLERFGALPQSDPEQSDLLIVSTFVTEKLGREIKAVYEAMPEPKYVMAVGACANCGGPFSDRGLDAVIPVDVYVAGCPPRPEAIMNGLIELQGKIRGHQERR